MENFCSLIEPHEEAIIQRNYIDKYASFYGFCIVSLYVALFALIMGPIVQDQSLPTPADFPFDESRQPLRVITYVHQIIIILQLAGHFSVNVFMALLLWLASARFRLLTENLRTITNIYDFVKCIEKHQHLLEYTTEIALTVRPFALGTVFFTTLSLITIGLIIIAGTSLLLTIQFVFLAFNGLMEVFMYTWPAEHLIHTSSGMAQAAFEMDWYEESNHFRKSVQMVILRSQKPIIVALPCGLPTLSLHYYASYLSTIFSYLTAMRVMFDD
ncbi:odorant receptor 22c [Harpegnathos saltator]|uniref:odorant receptor 22c n=1 Tax=Harpegnathos saltator TaxID=610380 RepID=UPI000DBEE5F5|nr:odorant receptor 22c [Harpegnathos saltator]